MEPPAGVRLQTRCLGKARSYHREPPLPHRIQPAGWRRCARSHSCAIVAVEPAKDNTSSSSETFIDRRCLSPIRLRPPKRQPLFPGPDHINALISAATIHHDIIKTWIFLAQDAVECFSEVPPLIE